MDHLWVSRVPLKPPYVKPHARCRTSGWAWAVRGGQKRPIEFGMMAGRIDRACFEQIEAVSERDYRSGRTPGDLLSFYYPLGRRPLVFLAPQPMRVNPGSYVVINPGHHARFETRNGFEGGLIQVTQSTLHALRRTMGWAHGAGGFDFDPAPRRFHPALRRCCREWELWSKASIDPAQDRGFILRCYGTALSWFGQLWAHHPSGLKSRSAALIHSPVIDPRVEDAMGYIREHLAQPLNNAVIADAVGLGLRSFLRAFQRQVGCAPHEWIRHVRVEAAVRRLQEPGATWETVAHAVGFQSRWALQKAMKSSGHSPVRPLS